MKLAAVALLLCSFYLHAPGAAAQAAPQQYFDQATTQYIVGDLRTALKSVDRALRAKPDFGGARKLKNSILRELKLGELSLAPVTVETPVPVAPAPAAGRPNKHFLWAGFILGLCLILLAVLALAIFLEKIFGERSAGKKPAETDSGSKLFQAISDDQKLWSQKLGWQGNPFTLDVHPELLTGYENEVKEVLGKINSHSGHILILGPLGIGKTTLLRWLANKLPAEQYHVVYIPRPPIDFSQLVAHIFQSLGYSPEQAKKESSLYNLGELRKKMKKYLIILLDEAHEFTIEVERPLRTLGDIDGVNLVMAGLPETIDKLKNEIQPLFERLVLQVTLDHLEFDELKDLIKARIESVGGKGLRPFTSAALTRIFERSNGNPRKAIKLCDSAIFKAIGRGEEIIGPEMIDELGQGVTEQ